MNLLLPGIDSGPAGASQTRTTNRTAAHRTTGAAKTIAAKPSTTVRKKPAALNLAIMAIAVPALFCTVALPAYAYSPTATDEGGEATAALSELKESDAQSVAISDALGCRRSGARHLHGDLRGRTASRAAARAVRGHTTDRRSGDFLANPPYPNFSLDQVVAVALQYQGVPYRFGGSNPSGFDCSGFTQFVYAQFGIALPHSVVATERRRYADLPGGCAPGRPRRSWMAAATSASTSAADMMIDAPRPGTVVQVRAIYNPAHWFVRYGI